MIDVELMILVGGASSRFGSDKAFLEVDGKPVIATLIERFRSAVPDGRATLVTSSEKATFPYPQVTDLYPGRGAWSGVHAALAYSRSEWTLVLACDLPFVTAELLSYLMERSSADVDIVVPIQPDGRPQPLCALYKRRPCLAIADGIVLSKRETPPLRVIFERVRTLQVPFAALSDLGDPTHLFTNVNTPSDLV